MKQFLLSLLSQSLNSSLLSLREQILSSLNSLSSANLLSCKNEALRLSLLSQSLNISLNCFSSSKQLISLFNSLSSANLHCSIFKTFLLSLLSQIVEYMSQIALLINLVNFSVMLLLFFGRLGWNFLSLSLSNSIKRILSSLKLSSISSRNLAIRRSHLSSINFSSNLVIQSLSLLICQALKSSSNPISSNILKTGGCFKLMLSLFLQSFWSMLFLVRSSITRHMNCILTSIDSCWVDHTFSIFNCVISFYSFQECFGNICSGISNSVLSETILSVFAINLYSTSSNRFTTIYKLETNVTKFLNRIINLSGTSSTCVIRFCQSWHGQS